MNNYKNLFLSFKALFLVVALNTGVSHKLNAQKDSATEKSGTIKTFDAFFKSRPVSDTGLFIIHRENANYYFEIPDSLLNKDMLIVSRRAAMSSSEIDPMVAGDNAQPGLMVVWDITPDGRSLLLKKVTTRNVMRFSGEDTAFQQALLLQTLDPILMSFPIKAKGKFGMSSIVDIKQLYVADIKELTPFAQNPLLLALGVQGKKYKLEAERSFLHSMQSFEKNIEVRSMLTYTEGDNTYTILVNRSMVLLPEVPMQPRFADDRVGYFVRSYSDFNEDNPVSEKYYISRWRLEPKEGEAHLMGKGILVEPKNPITFYIDKSTPAKWVQYIKLGIKDWLPAFEAAGFKNAIVAKDVPENDPDFNPEDIRYSVIRYTASDIPNAKGPSVTDPRSGEIMESDIIIYHNIFKLLRDWRFAQTAANDPRVRTTEISDEILGEALRYVVAHEVGHHVQNILGISDQVQQARQRMSEAEGNRLSVKLELQADFFAGVWAHHAQRMKNILETGDVEEALNATNAIGDDRLQQQSQGHIVPDAFTHGTSEQRMYWFSKGFQTGDPNQGDTFNDPNL